ncbi:unnamed protein product [Durusdinium trenchii]|uniref:Uncharacterized protein n=1 Tax=Durusdinium trenchii TaxID=1381693 RepID=A0ABP0J3E4_9DINO
MAACEGSGRWQTCVALLEAAQRRGPGFLKVSYNTILSSSARSAWQWALLLAEGLLSQDRRGSLPMADVVTLGTAFVACGEGMPTPKPPCLCCIDRSECVWHRMGHCSRCWIV